MVRLDEGRAVRIAVLGLAATLFVAACGSGNGPTTTFVSAEPARGPVAFTVMGPVQKLANGGRPTQKIPFPEMRDSNTLKFTLERGSCMGSCPVYSLEIDGDGTVRYNGIDYVAIRGRHVAKISAAAVHDLYAAFQKADFFWLMDEYTANITDNPEMRVGISFDGRSKQVVDYVGLAIGMPREVADLENRIDAVAQVNVWTDGNAETISRLKEERWDFRAPDDDHRQLIQGVAQSGKLDLVRDVLALGAPANNIFGCRGLEEAARSDNAPLVRVLLNAGASIQTEPVGHWVEDAETESGKKANETYYETDCDALSSAAGNGSAESVAILLARDPRVDRRNYRGRTALMEAADNSYSGHRADSRADFLMTAQLLISAGADTSLRDDQGNTILMLASGDADFIRLILNTGFKDTNAQNGTGDTALMCTLDADVARVLLESGLNPYTKNRFGETALDKAKSLGETKLDTLLTEWMKTHPPAEYVSRAGAHQ